MPRLIKKATKATKSKAPTNKKTILVAKKKSPQPRVSEFIVEANTVNQVFKTITLNNVDMGEGLWMMRKLGNDKYEVVNLNAVTQDAISSEEVGGRIKSIPKCLEMFRASQMSLKEVTSKLDQALCSAGMCLTFANLNAIHLPQIGLRSYCRWFNLSLHQAPHRITIQNLRVRTNLLWRHIISFRGSRNTKACHWSTSNLSLHQQRVYAILVEKHFQRDYVQLQGIQHHHRQG